jgi:multiple sugar transport system permease protein
MKYRKLNRIIRVVFITACLATALFPVYWMFNTSFKRQSEVYLRVPTFFPKSPTLEAYRYLFERTPFLGALRNSLIVALTSAVFSVFVAYPASYGVARIRFKGRSLVAKGILATYLIPASVLYIPLFIFISRIHVPDSLLRLIIIYPTFTLPYVAWMLIPHVRSVPVVLEEAAIIDGCGRLGVMYRIIFPLVMPGIVSTFIFAFSMCWGEYLYALVNISSTAMKTFPLIISGLIYGDIYPWGQIMAGAIIACIPIMFIYLFASSFLVGGVTAGGVKQ